MKIKFLLVNSVQYIFRFISKNRYAITLSNLLLFRWLTKSPIQLSIGLVRLSGMGNATWFLRAYCNFWSSTFHDKCSRLCPFSSSSLSEYLNSESLYPPINTTPFPFGVGTIAEPVSLKGKCGPAAKNIFENIRQLDGFILSRFTHYPFGIW